MKERFDKTSFGHGRTADVTKQALVGLNRFPPRLEWLSFPPLVVVVFIRKKKIDYTQEC